MIVALVFAGFVARSPSADAQRSPYGHQAGTVTAGVFAPEVLTIADATTLGAIVASDIRRTAGTRVMLASGLVYRFHATSTAADTTNNLVITPAAGAGRWLLVPGTYDLALTAVTFATADAAVVFTVPVGARILSRRGYWVNSIAWTGGSSSAVGLSSSNASYNTKGDLQGGSGGDLLAAMTAVVTTGSAIGAKVTAGILLNAADTVRFDRIVSIYTAGAGIPHLIVDVLLNPGV
jgi:hypothetical protein